MEERREKTKEEMNTLSAALNGNLHAQFELGIILEEVEQDYDLACDWYKKAAMKGHTDAAFRCGMLCLKLKGEREKEAVYWLGRAANAGHVDAQHHLAIALERGMGVKLDPEESLRWHRIAASYGHPRSKEKLDSLNEFLGS